MSESAETETCEKCRQPNIHLCDKCEIKFCFGCEEQDHWSKCKSFEICFDKSGYCLKATRDLFPGEIIFSEFPLAYGAKIPTDGSIPCIGCCRIISAENTFRCPECLWPACDPNCEDLKNEQRHGLECKVLRLQKPDADSANSFRFDILLPLKLLCLQTNKKHEWENLLKQMDDSSEKVDSNMNDLPKKSGNDTIKFLYDNYLTPLKKVEEETSVIILEEKSSDLLNKIVTHLKPIEFKSEENLTLEIYYPTFSLMEHSCTPNSFQTIENINKEYKITLRANSPITTNTHITSSFINLFQGTYERITDLKSSNSTCSCPRCKDPTEFGTFFSALKCLGTRKEPCGGTQLPVSATDLGTQWICDKCNIELPNDQMVKFVQHLGGEVDKILKKDATVEELEEFLAKLLMFLHPNHFYVCAVKHALVKLYDGDSISTKIDVCKSLVDVVRKLYPNGGIPLVELLLELLQAQVLLMQKSSNEEITATREEVENLYKELKSNLLVLFDPNLRKSFADEEAKLLQLVL